ncbi:hypothetical protein P8452_09217 [Trifolium repens]|nr:hypothetical protein P8452_09217 [Trifolium repens]
MDEDAKKVYKEVHELEPLFSMLIETLNRNLLQICDLCRGNVPETLYNFVGLAIGVIAEMIKMWVEQLIIKCCYSYTFAS